MNILLYLKKEQFDQIKYKHFESANKQKSRIRSNICSGRYENIQTYLIRRIALANKKNGTIRCRLFMICYCTSLFPKFKWLLRWQRKLNSNRSIPASRRYSTDWKFRSYVIYTKKTLENANSVKLHFRKMWISKVPFHEILH